MLKYSADRRTLGFVATYIASVVVAWNLDVSLPVQLAMMVGVCILSWFCAVITHNTIHAPIFKNRWMNKAFQVVLTQTYGHPVSTFVPGHNLSHHRFTEQPRDVMRTTKLRHRWNFLNLLLFFPTVLPGILRGERAYIRAMRTQKPKWFRQLLVEASVLGLITVVLLWLDWRKFLLFWYVPHAWAGIGIVTMNLLQHDGCDPDSEYNHSRNFTNPFFNWWTFNNGFHTIHHMKPTLHWSLTPAVHAEKVAPHMHPGLDEPSIMAYLWRAFVWPGRRMRYDGKPVVLPPRVEDQPWAPGPGETIVGMSLGAEG